MSFFKPQVSFSSNFASLFSIMKDKLLCTFLAQALYTLARRSPFKVQSTRIKIRQISHVSFKTASQFLFNIYNIVMTHNLSVNFKLIHFLLWTKGSHQSPNFDTFECSGENFLNSSCHFSNLNSVVLQILHHFSGS